MATDDIIQYLETTDADGTALGGAEMHRRQVETFLAGGAIAAGDVVAWDISKTGAAQAAYVVAAAAVATVGNAAAMGVALESASANQTVKVVISGYVTGAKCAAGVLAGQPVCGPISAAGTASLSVAAATAGVLGVALDNEGGGLVTMMVRKQF